MNDDDDGTTQPGQQRRAGLREVRAFVPARLHDKLTAYAERHHETLDDVLTQMLSRALRAQRL